MAVLQLVIAALCLSSASAQLDVSFSAPSTLLKLPRPRLACWPSF